MCSRDSSDRTNYEEAHASAERILKDGRVFGQLEKAEFVHVHLVNFSMRQSVLLSRYQTTRGSGAPTLHTALEKITEGTQVLFVCLGLDGTSGNITGWKDFVDKYQYEDQRRLELLIAFGENEIQWHKSSITRNQRD